MLINFYNVELWTLCASICGDRWARTVLIFQTCIPTLLSPQGSLQPRSVLKGRVHHGKWAWASVYLSLLWDQHGIRRIGLTLVKSPGITYHYLFLPQRKPKACSNCIINIIAVWGPIILSLSFTCPNLESGSAWIFEQTGCVSNSGAFQPSVIKAVWILDTAWRHSKVQHTTIQHASHGF